MTVFCKFIWVLSVFFIFLSVSTDQRTLSQPLISVHNYFIIKRCILYVLISCQSVRLIFNFVSLVDKCVPGPNFKLSDFKWELPKSCYGSCMAPNGNHEAFFWCDLPCLFYDGRSNPRECLIRGYYKDPHLIFAGRADCSDCTKADWENCWRTYPPSRIFGWIELKVNVSP